MQTNLNFEQEELILEEALEKHRNNQPEISLPKKIRNISYKQTINRPHTDIQRDMVEKIIQGHPEGITDMEISVFTGIRITSITARRNEIPDIIPIGIAKYTDEFGEDHLNTMWGKNINVYK